MTSRRAWARASGFGVAAWVLGCGPGSGGTGDPAGSETSAATEGGFETSSGGVAEAESGSESGSEGDTTVDPPTGVCSTSLVDHGDDCRDACPIALDLEIECDDQNFGLQGLRVAADEDSTFAAASGDGWAWLFEADAAGDTQIDELPAAFARTLLHLAQGTDGRVWLAADTGVPAGGGQVEGGVVIVARDGDGWSEDPVYAAGDHFTRITDFAMVADEPHLWFPTVPPDELSHAMRDDGGTWQLDVVESPTDGGGWKHFGLVDDETIGLDLVETGGGTRALVSRLGGDESPWDGTDVDRGWGQYRLAAPPPTGVVAADFPLPVALFADEGVRVAWGPGPGLAAADVPDTAYTGRSCGSDLQPPRCELECHHEVSGVAEPMGTFAIARTDDGATWLAVAITHVVQDWQWREECPKETDCSCVGDLVGDASTGELRLYRIDPADASATVVLSVPTDAPARADVFSGGIAIDARAWGDDLAIGLRLRTDVGANEHGDPGKLRVLRIDTALLRAP